MAFSKQELADSIIYPHTDGKPMAENTKQLRWIVSLYTNLRWLVQSKETEAFVAADLFWYPVEGEPRIVVAPDVMVVVGRPDGDRLSYQQWKENDQPPQLVIEVLSPGNRPLEMREKESFYERHGVQEYLVIDPDERAFQVFLRKEDGWQKSDFPLVKWQSPLLGFWLKQEEGELHAYYPDGSPFKTFDQIQTELEEEKRKAKEAQAEVERLRARLRELGEE